MRTRINKYTIIGERQIKLDTPITIEDVRLIINETKKIVIASSMQKDNITIEGGVITYTDALPISEIGDYFTIEIDKGETIKDILGDANVLLSDVAEGKRQIADAINTKGGSASAESSFQQLAEDIKDLPVESLSDAGYIFRDGFKPKTYAALIEHRNDIIEIDDPTITRIDADYAFANLSSLRKVRMVNLEVITGTYCFNKDSNLEKLDFPKLRTIYKEVSVTMYTFKTKQEELILPSLEYMVGNYIFTEVLSKSVIMPLLSTVNSQTLGFQDTLQNIVFGKLTSYNARMSNTNSTMLRNITIGKDTDINLNFSSWTATNVISEGQSGIDELNNNLRTNLLEKLADHSEDGQTRTLHLGWLAHVTQENIDYANAKGWTLTT